MTRFGEVTSYRSPERERAVLARLFPDLYFYAQMMGVYWNGSRKAKRGAYDGNDWIKSSEAVLRALESVGVKVKVENMGAFINLDSPCVFIGNHMSTLETFVLPCIIQPHRDVTFVVKESLINYPVFKYIMRARDPVVVGRTDAREDLKRVLVDGSDKLGKGRSIIIFPQTTRSVGLDPEQFNSIGVKLARRAKVPIVPIALKTDAWGVGRWVKDFGKIHAKIPAHICFGEPMTVSGNGRDEQERIVGFIREKLEKWK
ncbi:MAG: 1-acyl-sn-glycerol-3-phosphate acyltransferase [Deltaproteobacteria bacterium]|nr:1-acyl-sn-glycerol-3-phosphate acyltransferase [Deltaproteobacteria bacterium]